MKLLGKAGAHKVRVLDEGFRLLSPSVDSDAHNVCRQDDDVGCLPIRQARGEGR